MDIYGIIILPITVLDNKTQNFIIQNFGGYGPKRIKWTQWYKNNLLDANRECRQQDLISLILEHLFSCNVLLEACPYAKVPTLQILSYILELQA